MPVDNRLYDTMADSWWEESGFLHVLRGLNPGRFGYMRRILLDELAIDPKGKKTLDVGCGGGLLAEELARLGFDVTGIDPSAQSVAAARTHARQEGLAIEYRQAAGESIPFPDGTFDVVYCCDVLEHVENVGKVIAEISRVLKPGGVFLFDTINRTLRSKLVVIKLFQDWDWTSFMPPALHDWDKFIKPEELLALLAENGLQKRGLTGLTSAAGTIRTIRLLRARKRGEISYYEAARRIGLRETRDMSVSFIGHAIKTGIAADVMERSSAPRRSVPTTR